MKDQSIEALITQLLETAEKAGNANWGIESTENTYWIGPLRKSRNWIDEVVEWSRTDRGGRQFNILNQLERPACESKFGLCE